MAPLVHPFPWLRPCIHTTAVREHLDYCDGSLSDIVCNLCMVDKPNLTRAPLGGGAISSPPSGFLAISSKPMQVSPPNLQYPLSQQFYTLC